MSSVSLTEVGLRMAVIRGTLGSCPGGWRIETPLSSRVRLASRAPSSATVNSFERKPSTVASPATSSGVAKVPVA